MSSKNLLEAALDAAFTDPSRQGGVETALLAAELYVSPTGGKPADGVVLGRDAPFRLNGIVLQEGHQATAAFTRTDFATALFGEPASMAIRGRHLLEAFVGGWIVLNLGQEKGLVLSPTDISAILAHAGDAQPTVEDPNIEVLTPEPAPTALIANMRAVLDHPRFVPPGCQRRGIGRRGRRGGGWKSMATLKWRLSGLGCRKAREGSTSETSTWIC